MRNVLWSLAAGAMILGGAGMTSTWAEEKKDAPKVVTPEEKFAALDTDKDQKLSVEEAFKVKKGAPVGAKRLAMFHMADKDKNGSLSLEEFKAYLELPANKKPSL